MRIPDALATHNERVKLVAGFFNAIAIGLVGFALLRPIVEDMTGLTAATLWWVSLAFAFHLLAHYVLTRLEKEVKNDSL